MVDAQALGQLLNDHPTEVQEALAALPTEYPVQIEALRALSKLYDRPLPDLLAELLQDQARSERFVSALRKRGLVPDQADVEEVKQAAARANLTNISERLLSDFISRASTSRCRIVVGDKVMGSGCIVSPHYVLTAWHVIRTAVEAERPPRVEVLFTDNSRSPVKLPASYSSRCSDGELNQLLPASDDEVHDKNDVALLSLVRPAGPHLGAVTLPAAPRRFNDMDPIFLAHYPAAEDRGFGTGTMKRFPNLQVSRIGHTIETKGGSSGGPCFTKYEDGTIRLAGLHQARGGERGRMVPVNLYLDQLKPLVESDAIPDMVWSLDGTPDGDFVIGRYDFFQAFAAAVRKEGRIRGLRIKRSNAATDATGIPFSYAILLQLVTPRTDMRVARIPFEEVVDDLPAEIVRRAEAAGVTGSGLAAAEGLAAGPGAGEGDSAPEAVAADRGRKAAIELNARAEALGIKLWTFFDHPSVVFGDQHRFALEGFLEQALRMPHLRLVLAGFEAVALPGLEFRSLGEAEGSGQPGLFIEYLSGFRLHDVEAFIEKAAKAIGYEPPNYNLPLETVRHYARDAVFGLEGVNGVYHAYHAGAVAARLRPILKRLAADVFAGTG